MVQVVAYCPSAPSHYLNQSLLIMNMVPWHSGPISEEILNMPINKVSLENKLFPHLPESNELKVTCDVMCLSLGPSDAIRRWRSWSTLVQVMACYLTAPSH